MQALSWISGLAILLFTFSSVHAGNTTCAGTSLDWYTNAVGETPCITYQRLRQICDSTYQVPTFRTNTPGDNCDSQITTCCCNSISWILSMLCMNCQLDVNGNVNGIDAGKGAYQMYLTSGNGMCSSVNMTLPSNIQTAVCNRGIQIDAFIYNLFWGDGSWFYTYSREAAELDQASNSSKPLAHCPNTTTSTTTSSTSTSSSTSSPNQTTQVSLPSAPTSTTSSGSSGSNSSHTGAIVGGVIGGVAAILILAVAGFYFGRKHGKNNTHYAPAPFAPPPSDYQNHGGSTPFDSDFGSSRRGLTEMSESRSPPIPSSNVSGMDNQSSNLSVSDRAPREGASFSQLRPNVLGAVRDTSFSPTPNTVESLRSLPPVPVPVNRVQRSVEEDAGPVTMPSDDRMSFTTVPPAYNPAWDPLRRQSVQTTNSSANLNNPITSDTNSNTLSTAIPRSRSVKSQLQSSGTTTIPTYGNHPL